jgi:hypothetical protein
MQRSRAAPDRNVAIALAVFLLTVSGLGGIAEAALPAATRDAHSLWSPPPGTAIQLTRVQLGAWRTAIEAAHGWDRIQRRAAGTMDGLSPRVVPADLPGRGTFYRLWVGPVLKASVSRFCARLRSQRIDCIPAPPDPPGTVRPPASGDYQATERP